jgi:hypothetical protein
MPHAPCKHREVGYGRAPAMACHVHGNSLPGGHVTRVVEAAVPTW